MSTSPRETWVVACPDTGSLNVIGPWEVLAHANDLLGREAYALSLRGPGGRTLRTGHGLSINDTAPLPADPAGDPHTLIVAGASPAAPPPAPQTRLARWLRRHHGGIPRVVSICTGAFVLGEAGLLDGRRATTHWRHVPGLRARFPRATVVNQELYTRDGRVWTSAGTLAGIDLTLALVEADEGREAAMAVAKNLLLFLHRSGHQSQFSPTLLRQESTPPRLADLTGYVLDHIAEPIPVRRLADHFNLSPRTLTRWCRDHLGQPPATLVRGIRLDEARRLLEETDLPLRDIAARTGIGGPTTLWRSLTNHLGVSPTDYRSRFTSRCASGVGTATANPPPRA